MADTHNEAEVKTNYPVEDGIIARTTTQQGHKMQLEAQGINGVKSIVREIDKAGF
jgi:hypothetical protein